jgi:hypothetical protein
MILTEKEIKDRLESPDNIVNIIHKVTGKGQHKKQTRTENVPNKTQEERALIGLTANIDTIANTAKAFDCSPASVSAYKAGLTSLNPNTRSEANSAELKELVTRKTSQVSDTALDKLMDMMEQVDSTNPKAAKLITSTAKDLADIFDKMRPISKEHNGIRVTIMAPNLKPLDAYEIIEVNVEN